MVSVTYTQTHDESTTFVSC